MRHLAMYRLIGVCAITFAATASLPQQPSFGRAGLWERAWDQRNARSDGKPQPPSKEMEQGCGSDARLDRTDPDLQDIDRADRTCSYSDIKGSENSMSWTYQCGESARKSGRSRGTVHHQYDPRTNTIVQRNVFSLDFIRGRQGAHVTWGNATGESIITAKRIGECSATMKDKGRWSLGSR